MWIERSLALEDRDGEIRSVSRKELGHQFNPMVLLGDPGMGKTALMRHMCEQEDKTYIHAARLLRADDPDSLVPDIGRVFVDGLDEIASSGRGSALDAVLKQLVKAGNPQFMVSCRSAEWHGAVDRARIEAEYAGELTTLYLMPFDDDQVHAFLKHEFPGVQVHALLQNLENRTLIHACRNPLSLRLFGEIAQAGGGLPREPCRALRAGLPRNARP